LCHLLLEAVDGRDTDPQLLGGGVDAEEKRQRRLKAELAAQTTFALVAVEYIQKMEQEGRSGS